MSLVVLLWPWLPTTLGCGCGLDRNWLWQDRECDPLSCTRHMSRCCLCARAAVSLRSLLSQLFCHLASSCKMQENWRVRLTRAGEYCARTDFWQSSPELEVWGPKGSTFAFWFFSSLLNHRKETVTMPSLQWHTGYLYMPRINQWRVPQSCPLIRPWHVTPLPECHCRSHVPRRSVFLAGGRGMVASETRML